MLRAIPLYLIGDRRAIHSLARAPHLTLPIGALLVLSAALARNYDGEDLLAEPWHLLGPFGASVATSLLLFVLYKAICSVWYTTLPWKTYPSFLGLYWLTAPLAWLYGIPFERFTSPETAIYANLWLLLIVSAWRVTLMARVAQVMLEAVFLPAMIINLFFGAVVIFAASMMGPAPVLDVMGGLRLAPEERLRGELHFATTVYSFLAIPVLFIAGLIALRWFTPGRPLPRPASDRISFRAALALTASLVAIAAWVPGLLIAQPEQRARRIVESAWERGDVHAMLRELSARAPGDFPPHWRPPRRVVFNTAVGGMTPIFNAFADLEVAPWAREYYTQEARRALAPMFSYHAVFDLDRLVTDEPERWTEALPAIRFLIEHDPALSDADRERLQRFRERVAAARP